MKKNLPNWKRFVLSIKNDSMQGSDFGFLCKDGDITRLNARYRLVNSFKKIELESYSENSIDAYSAFFKVFLVYSLFEQYIKCIYQKDVYKNGLKILNEEREKLSKKLLKLDKKRTFYTFLMNNTNRTHQKDIENFYNSNDHNIIFLFSSIRHVFAHGKLTASVNKTSPKKVMKICNLLSEYFLTSVKNDFVNKITKVSKND